MQSKLQCKETTVLALNNVYIIYIYIVQKNCRFPKLCLRPFGSNLVHLCDVSHLRNTVTFNAFVSCVWSQHAKGQTISNSGSFDSCGNDRKHRC